MSDPVAIRFDNLELGSADPGDLPKALHAILDKYPKNPLADMPPQVWVQTVTRAICSVVSNVKNEKLESRVFQNYLTIYGWEQWCNITGNPIPSNTYIKRSP